MKSRTNSTLFLAIFVFVLTTPLQTTAQISLGQLQNLFSKKASFTPEEFVQLEQGQTVVKAFAPQNQRDIAVCGLVKVDVPAKEFLASYREMVVHKSNPAILEIGSFSTQMTLSDLDGLTIDARDIEDLKECAIGRCEVKLSSEMIHRFETEVDWSAPDYRVQAANLFKRMLLDYVIDYSKRGDTALISYSDQSDTVHVADEQQALLSAAVFAPAQPDQKLQHHSLKAIEKIIVWSKMSMGLKPVISINEITFYTGNEDPGPQVLIASKQLYANHYFDSSIALTTFLMIPGSGSYLYYENRSRVDGLGGFFGKMKRGIVESKAVDSLKSILDQSKINLHARMARQHEPGPVEAGSRNWRRWKSGGVPLILVFLVVTGFTAVYALGGYGPRSNLGR